ncbi:MAG TPA: PfkB family carbohydrate kinase [Candidatus Latescibacteria bacterium]|nr:PfkB family carbohydrate kinase [Candidatus Latescibacterota bacterium]
MPDSLLIVGSVAYDNVETPGGRVENALGGSALFGAAAASLFAPVHLVGIVGTDFDRAGIAFLEERGVDLAGLETAEGKTFRWTGVYEEDMNNRRTLATELNVFADFAPRIPEGYRGDKVVFLGNIAPRLQLHVLDQMAGPDWVALDTMDMWIRDAADDLARVLQRVHMVVINDSEARALTGKTNLTVAARSILDMGPRAVVVKKGEHGVLLAAEDEFSVLPALPLKTLTPREPAIPSRGECSGTSPRQAISPSPVCAGRLPTERLPRVWPWKITPSTGSEMPHAKCLTNGTAGFGLFRFFPICTVRSATTHEDQDT